MKRIKQVIMWGLILSLIVGTGQALPTHAATANSAYEKAWIKEPPQGEYEKVLGTMKDAVFTLDMWHYSSYWKVGNKGADKIVVQDDDLREKEITSIIADTGGEFTKVLPEDISAAIAAELAVGNKIITYIKPAKPGIELDDLFDSKSSMEFKLVGSELYFSATPIFELIDRKVLNYETIFDPILEKAIPFVNPLYGCNIYAMYEKDDNGKFKEGLGQAAGWLEMEIKEGKSVPVDASKTPEGRIHHDMIKDSTGALKEGYKINVAGTVRDSKGLYISGGYFNTAGGVGLHFEYPVEFVFYSTSAETECEACGDTLKDGTSETACSATSCKDWGKPECGCTEIPDNVGAIPPATSGCGEVIKWSETKEHTYKCSGCKKKKRTGKKYCPGHKCTHIYTYQTSLTAGATLNPTTLKSGYGFTVNANNTITAAKQISNSGSCNKTDLTKAADKKPTPPTKVEVRINWTYKNEFGGQAKILQMEKVSSSGTASTFQMPANKLSPKKERRVYTAVELAGTSKKPAKHNVVIYVAGGGVSGVAEFCKTITKQITINGNMYQDDHTSGR